MNASDQAVEGIVQLLIQHEYRPGDRLFETTLTERLKMSRTPIRVALTHLVACGFLEKAPRQKGYLIPVLLPGDMRLVYETRGLLEGALAAQAARNRSREDAEALRANCRLENAAFDAYDRKTYSECNERFHLSVAKYAQNPYLEHCLNQVFWRSRLYDFYFSGFYDGPLTKDKKQRCRSCGEHLGIVDAIEAEDSSLAKKLMESHITNTYEVMVNPDWLEEHETRDAAEEDGRGYEIRENEVAKGM